MPYFSVVIPLFNKEKFIAETIRSVLNQSFQDFEVLIVNDGSTDKSLKLINGIHDTRIRVFTTENQGASHARNFGIIKSVGDYIALLDGDDLWHPNHLKNMANLIEEFPSLGAYCSGYNFQINQKHIKKTNFNGIPANFSGLVSNFFDKNMFDPIINSSNVVIPKEIFTDLGYFKEKMKSGQDTLMWIKLALKYQVAINNIITVTVVKNNNSLSRSPHVKDRVMFLESFKKEEANNKFLKKFMDFNRFAIVLRMKRDNEIDEAKKLLQKIDLNNLNLKQRIVLALPNRLLRILYAFKQYMENEGIYLYLYR